MYGKIKILSNIEFIKLKKSGLKKIALPLTFAKPRKTRQFEYIINYYYEVKILLIRLLKRMIHNQMIFL